MASCTLPTVATAYQEMTAVDGVVDPTQQIVHVTWPAAGHPVQPQTIVMVHGGGGNEGTPTSPDVHNTTLQLVSLGYVVVSAGYRLAPSTVGGTGYVTHAQESDVRCAARWAEVHAADFGADGSRLVMMGDSMGATFSLLSEISPASFDDRSCALTNPGLVKGVLAWSAVYDWNGAQSSTMAVQEPLVLGASCAASATCAAANSPVSYGGPTKPKLLLLHWSGDPIVPVSQATAMEAAVTARGEDSTLIVTNGPYHAPSIFLPLWPTVGCTALSFIAGM
jgi:acetyl esterase/lipase